MDSHRNVLHNVMRYTNGLGIAPSDRLTLLQSPIFSGAVSSMFCALLNGAASLPFDVRRASGGELADYVEREGITIYHSVPTMFRSFLRGERVFPAVRVVRLEGDRAAQLDVELFRRHFTADCVLVNGLGATETGLVRRFVLGQDTPLDGEIVPIGYPVEDMDVRCSTRTASRPRRRGGRDRGAERVSSPWATGIGRTSPSARSRPTRRGRRALSDRRSGAPAARRLPRASGAQGLAHQDSRRHRVAGRGRGGARGPAVHPRGRGDRRAPMRTTSAA